MDSAAPHEPAVASLEDALASAMWVLQLTDAYLSADRLHEAFNEVIFRFPATEEGGTQPQQRLLTARERERERRRAEEMRRDMDELLAPLSDGGDATEEEDDEETFIDEDEDEDGGYSGAQVMMDAEFLNWIDGGGYVPPEEEEAPAAAAAAAAAAKSAVELDLRRVGLGRAQEDVASDALPDRFKMLSLRERRPMMGSRPLPGGYIYELPLEQEAYWVLRQLRSAGQPLAHNTEVCGVANRPLAEVADHPLLVSIVYALQKMTREFLEPAHLMVYHQTPLHPLLCALLRDSPAFEAAASTFPSASYAYSTVTGRRQRPYLSDAYVGFGSLANRSIGEGDYLWNNIRGIDSAQRKPCFMELGRLLVRILELDSLCHSLEHRRQQMLLLLRDHPEARVQDQRTLLEGVVFESAVEADIWHSFVHALVGGAGSRGPFERVRAMGLEDAFEEYTITGLQYQENLIANAPVHLCPVPRMPLDQWAEQVGGRLNPPRSGDAVLALFNHAIVDQFLRLPALCRAMVGLFCAEGSLIVVHRNTKRPDDIYPLADFFVDHPRHYLDLVQREHQGMVELHYILDEDLVRRVMNLDQLYQRPSADDWHRERAAAMELLVVRLVESLVPRVKAELNVQAHYHVDAACVQRLGVWCGQGPYERTRLELEEFDEERMAWEPEWNVVEALPARDAPRPPGRVSKRVCAAFRGENGIASFSFIDEAGVRIGKATWADVTLASAAGRAVAAEQEQRLEREFLRCAPAVVAVAASDQQSLGFLRSIQRFLERRVSVNLRVEVPVVWVSAEVARFCSATHYAEMEMPDADYLERVSLAQARYVQDPLNVLCVLFDSRRTAMQLCINRGDYISSEWEDQLYERLCWEMTLWVTASGFWVEDTARRPHSVAALQFVAGLGIAKARHLLRAVTEEPPASRTAVAAVLTRLFGDAVARNAASAIRVGSRASSAAPHPLDSTLVPPQWYGIAALAATVALKQPQTSGPSAAVALITLLAMAPEERRRLLHAHANQQDLIETVRAQRCAGWDTLPGERELELILEEMIAIGYSALRRPYRRVSTRELLGLITGVLFLPRGQEAAAPAADADPAKATNLYASVVREGDYVTATVNGVRGGRSAGVRVSTSSGLRAFIAASDISDEERRLELLAHVARLEEDREARRRGQAHHHHGADAQPAPPAWLERGALIHGTVARCNWQQCELLLRWCTPREEVAAAAPPESRLEVPSYADILRAAASSNNSLHTVQMERNAEVYATKISTHPLFRNVTTAGASELLRKEELGEILFHPRSVRSSRSGRPRNYRGAICVIKAGKSGVLSISLREERRPNGKLFFSLHDRVVGEELEFDEVDQLELTYIHPLVKLTLGIRNHRRFVENPADVPAELTDQTRQGRGFAYAFTEESSADGFLYHVHTRGGGKEHRFALHLTAAAVYVCLPFQAKGGYVFRWVQCRGAEHVSETIKKHAIHSAAQ